MQFFFEISESNQNNQMVIEEKFSTAIERLNLFEQWLSRVSHPPLVITLARSVMTGYTPPSLVGRLEDSVIKIINKTWTNVLRRNIKRS